MAVSSERDLPAWASEYIGIPYKTHGRDRLGCDCWGLLDLVQRERLGTRWRPYEGVDWFDGQDPKLVGQSAADYASGFTPIPSGEEQLGDGILLRMRGHPFHCGLVLARGWMLHTHERADSVIEPYRSMRWEKRITGFYRYEGA